MIAGHGQVTAFCYVMNVESLHSFMIAEIGNQVCSLMTYRGQKADKEVRSYRRVKYKHETDNSSSEYLTAIS